MRFESTKADFLAISGTAVAVDILVGVDNHAGSRFLRQPLAYARWGKTQRTDWDAEVPRIIRMANY